MAIAVQLDEIMEDRGVSLQKLSHCVGITEAMVAELPKEAAPAMPAGGGMGGMGGMGF